MNEEVGEGDRHELSADLERRLGDRVDFDDFLCDLDRDEER